MSVWCLAFLFAAEVPGARVLAGQREAQRCAPNDERPLSNVQRPATNDQRPATNNERPATNNQRPGTNDQRLTTNDHLTIPPPTYPAVVPLLKDPARALAALDGALSGRPDPPAEALVLRAHLLSDAHRHRESVAAWDAAAARDPALRSFAQRSAIADLLEAGDLAAAGSRVRSVVGPRPDAQDDLLLLALADAQRAAGQSSTSSDMYREILGRRRQTSIADRARLGLAASEEAAGHLDAALTALHEATVSWRSADTFSKARAEERRLAGTLRRDPTPLTSDQYFSVAARLSASSHFDEAVELLEEGRRARRVTPADKLEAAVIETLYRGRRNDAATERAQRFLVSYPGSKLAPAVRLIQIRLDIRLGNGAQARKRLDSLKGDKSVPASVRQSAQRLVAADLVSSGSPRDGLVLYRQLLRSTMPRSDRFDLAWRAGIAALRAGDDRAAVDLLKQARRYAPGRATPRSTVYWLAAALSKTGNKEEADGLWGALLAESASDYYGIRSADRLQNRRASAVRETRELPPMQLSAAALGSDDFVAATVLARAGLVDDAASLLASLARRLRGDDALALLAARAASAVGDYATAWSLVATRFGTYLAQPVATVPSDIWHMAFPRAYWPEVAAAAAKSNVDPLLLLSLMRRESRFVTAARSRTGALGLFQIMPETAKEIVATVENPAEGERLTDAPASAELAARLVRGLMTRFGGATPAVVAAYNAGEDRVQVWWRAANGLPEDLFVDSIPYGETRQYVREVLANYEIYKRLYREK